jgi:hypothetical protein
MIIDNEDLDYRLIGSSFSVLEGHREEWKKFENLFETITDEKQKEKAKRKKRANKVAPIGHDVIKIIRSIFTTSFLSNKMPMVIEKLGSEDNERARQLRIACAYHWGKSQPYLELSKAFLSMLIFPIGIISQYWCPLRKKQIINYENPINVAFDPVATNPSDVQFVCYKYRKTARDIYSKMKEQKQFYNKIESIAEFFPSYDTATFEPFRRYELEEIYIRVQSGWLCKTYSSEMGLHLRTVKFERLPFQWGFALEQLDSVDEIKQENQVMSYGKSLIGSIEFHIKEINQRRSQHSDIIEKQINPDVFIGAGAEVKPSLLDKGPGTKIAVTDVTQIKERQSPLTIGLHDDMSMLKKDIETTVGVNSILQGETNSSDRRSQGALAMLNSQSSTRVEEMIRMGNETLFNHLIKSFVYSIYKNIDSETLFNLGVEDPQIGVDFNHPFDLTVKAEFGSEAKNLERYGDISQLLQLLGQFQNVRPEFIERLIEEGVRIKMGDEDESFKRIFIKEEPVPTATGGI